MTVIIEIPEEIKGRLQAEAIARGVPVRQFVQDLLVDHYEEAEDRRTQGR